MDEFQLHLQGLIAKNKIPQVIKILLETLQKCQSKNPKSREDVAGIRNQVVILSARYNTNNEKILKGIMDPIHADTAKNQVISSFLNLISHLPESTEFAEYINHREEEEAWDKTLEANTIEAYKIFFTQYPNGKYKDETQRVIGDLENIQKEKENEIKQIAEEEKARRVKEEQEIKEREQASNELKDIKKEKEALLAKKEKAQEELDLIERKTQAALNTKKEQTTINKNNNTTKSDELQKAQEELENIKKEKEALLAQKRQTESDLQKVEQQRKAAARRQKTADAKKKETIQKLDTKQQTSFSKKQATDGISATPNLAYAPKQSQSLFGKLFNQTNRWWTLTSLILAPITGVVITFERSLSDSFIFFFLGLTFLSYVFVAFKFPLKPAWHSLIATATGAILFTIAVHLFDSYGLRDSDFFLIPTITFLPVSFFTLPICFFRNKSKTKEDRSLSQ